MSHNSAQRSRETGRQTPSRTSPRSSAVFTDRSPSNRPSSKSPSHRSSYGPETVKFRVEDPALVSVRCRHCPSMVERSRLALHLLKVHRIRNAPRESSSPAMQNAIPSWSLTISDGSFVGARRILGRRSASMLRPFVETRAINSVRRIRPVHELLRPLERRPAGAVPRALQVGSRRRMLRQDRAASDEEQSK